MTTIARLEDAAIAKISSISLRIDVLNLIYDARNNADDTLEDGEIGQGDWNDFAVRSLELLVAERDVDRKVQAWFRKQGLSF